VDAALHALAVDGDPRQWRDTGLWEQGSADIGRIEIRYGTAAGQRVVLARAAGKWRIESPVATRADTESITGYLDALARAQVDAFAADMPDDLGTFGLQTPESTHAFLESLGALPSDGERLVAIPAPPLPAAKRGLPAVGEPPPPLAARGVERRATTLAPAAFAESSAAYTVGPPPNFATNTHSPAAAAAAITTNETPAATAGERPPEPAAEAPPPPPPLGEGFGAEVRDIDVAGVAQLAPVQPALQTHLPVPPWVPPPLQ
jgi:hypothetical protein